MGTLSITQRSISYEDDASSNNPQQRNFDWSRQLQGIPVAKASSVPYSIPPLQSVELFNGSRTLCYDDSTEFSLSVSSISANRYRLSWTGNGLAPVFRTARTIVWPVTPVPTVTIVPQQNKCVVVTSSAGAIFGNVVEGDTVYIPGISTGDTASVFDPLNEGFWSVLSASTTTLVLARDPNLVYSAKGQTVSITSGNSFRVFSSDGVQLDDTLSFSSGFPMIALQSYEIVSVTATSIDFLSGVTLPPLTSVYPGSGSIVVFSNAKTWVLLETDQNLRVSINGGETFTVEPILAGDSAKVGKFEILSTVYLLDVTNKSTQKANIKVLSAE